MNTVLKVSPRNGSGPQYERVELRPDIDKQEACELYKRVLRKPFALADRSAVSRMKRTHENPNRAMRKLARKMHAAGYEKREYMLLVADLVALAGMLWGVQREVTHACIVEASKREQECEGRENELQLDLHGDPTMAELIASRDAHLASHVAEGELIERLNAIIEARAR